MKDKKEDRRRGHQFVDHYTSSLSYGRSKRGRIRHLNRKTELVGHFDPEIEQRMLGISSPSQEELEREDLIDRQVRSAVGKLSPAERQFIELFYFHFKSYREIAGIMMKKNHKLQRLHQRALSRLRILLADFVQEQFKLTVSKETNCVICRSPFRKELERLIRGKKEEETYSRLMRVFREEYGVDVRTPQTIIGHRRKHMV